MEQNTLYVKNMVCRRCIKVVAAILADQHIQPKEVRLGEVILTDALSRDQKQAVEQGLRQEGFELISNQQSRTISAIKNTLIELIHRKDLTDMNENISDYLARNLHKDYNYLSNLFSASENVTIEQFVIQQKIEKVKELLVYDELSLSDIAFKMRYSSTAHLSAQFKKVTGFSPTQFKQLKNHTRKSLDEI